MAVQVLNLLKRGAAADRLPRADSGVHGLCPMGNTSERLHFALRSLVGAAPMRRRLVNAALTLSPLRTKDFPDHGAADTFGRIMHDLTHVEAIGGEGNIEATVKLLSDDEAERIAREILGLYHRMVQLET